MAALLKDLAIPDRPYAQVPSRTPPYFCSIDCERRAGMVAQAGEPDPLQEKVKSQRLRLFTPPPPPSYVPLEAFGAKMHAAVEQRYRDTKTAVDRLRARGGKIVFVRFPVTSPLKEHENKFNPPRANL